MATPLNILIAEDSPHDAEMMMAQLRRDGFDPKWKRVETERDFLAIGGKLTEFLSEVKQVSSELVELTELFGGEHGVRASEALSGTLERSTEMGRRAEKGSQLLGSMSLEAGRLKQTLDGFNGTISIFGTLGTLTRIETSRLGSVGADFGNLADGLDRARTGDTYHGHTYHSRSRQVFRRRNSPPHG